ncbi:MAG: DUF4124 domain-containing protein [Spongiibacteraceae bacterium]
MLKKLIMLIVVLAVVVVGVFFYGKRTPESRLGGAVAYIERALPQLFATGHVTGSDLTDLAKGALDQGDKNVAKQEGKATVYKWRDANGNWTYGNTPPPGVQATAQELDLKQTNRMTQ